MKLRTRVAGVSAATAAAVAMMGPSAFAQSAPFSILSGNTVNALLSVPVNVCGVAAGILAALGQTSRGRLVVIGDPSTLMNSMLRYPGNAQLARNLAFFVARHGGKVYLASGAFEETGTFAGSPETSDGVIASLVRRIP